MTAHRRLRSAAGLLAVSLLAAGCGLSDELDRESDPGRRPDTAPATTPAVPSMTIPAPVRTGALPGEPTRPATPATTSCPASGVRAEPGPVDAAMGLRAMTVRLTNCGKEIYQLGGYPALTVLDEDREPLDVQVLKGPGKITTLDDPGPHPVSLARGESATTSLVWRNTVTDPTTTAVNAPYLRITPVEGGPTTVLTVDGGLDLGNTGRLGTTAWKKAG